jgi:methoxymalonate biosynthesis acyl carrier protein
MKEQIKNYLKQKISRDMELDYDVDIFEKGLVNSMFALQLVMYLEKEFKIKIENNDLNLSNFNTVNNISAFVESKQKQAV